MVNVVPTAPVGSPPEITFADEVMERFELVRATGACTWNVLASGAAGFPARSLPLTVSV